MKSINEKIELLKENGLINFWHLQDVGARYLNPQTHKDNFPKILNLETLMGCFQILIIGNAISCIVFFLECMTAMVNNNFGLRSP